MNATTTWKADPPALKAAKHVGDRGLDLGVRVHDYLAFVVVDVSDRQPHPQLASLGRGLPGALQPAGQKMQLGLGHLVLHAQHQPVVDIGQIVDPIGVDDQRVGQAGQLQQAGQVRGGSGQSGHLEAENGAHLAQTDPAEEILEPGTVRRGAAGQAQSRRRSPPP